MAIDQLARTRLLRLADGDIARIGGQPRIGESWAYLAKTAPSELAKGSARAVKAVRAALIRDARRFADDLAVYWDGYLAPLAMFADADDPIAYRVQLAAREIGPTTAAALVACVAAGNLEDSEAVTERLEELTALSDHPLPDESAEDDDAASEIHWADPPIDIDDPQPASANAVGGHAVDSVEQLLASTAELRAGADALANLLQDAVADVRAGRPTRLTGSELDAWSDSVRALLAEAHSTVAAGDLGALEADLQVVIDQRATGQGDALKALEHVEYLTSSGLEAVVPDALRELGFESLEQARRLAGVGDEPATEPDEKTDLDVQTEADAADVQAAVDDHRDSGSAEAAAEEPPLPDDESTPNLATRTGPDTASAPTLSNEDALPSGHGMEPGPDVTGLLRLGDDANTRVDDSVGATSEAPTAVAAVAGNDDAIAQEMSSVQEYQGASAPIDDNAGSSAAATASEDVSADLAHHVRDGHFGAAWFIAQAAGLRELDAVAYRLAAAAFQSGPGGLDPSEVLISITATVSDGRGFSCQSARVALAATLRTALAAGWSPRSELETVAGQANLGASWRPLIDAAIAAGDRGYRHLHDFSDRTAISIDQIHEKTHALRDELSNLRIKFARADKVLRYLLRSTQPVGAAFEAVLAPTGGDERRRHLAAALAELEYPDNLIDAADTAVSTAQQRRQFAIDSHARTKLRRAIESSAECVSEALNAAVVSASDTRAAVTDEARHNLLAALQDVAAVDDETGPGDAAMSRLVEWIVTPQAPSPVTSEVEALIVESLPIVSGVRDEIGLPVPGSCEAADIIAELRAPLPQQELFETYLVRGDLQEAEAVGRHLPNAVDRLATERASWERRLIREVRAVRSELARTYADDPARGADAEAQLVTPAGYAGDRFDLQMFNLFKLRGALALQRNGTAELLRQRLNSEVSHTGARDRIGALIDNEDFVGANELLALARRGSLPVLDVGDSPAGAHVFDAFTAALSELEPSSGASIHDLVASFANGNLTDVTAHGDLERLRSWDNLIQRRGHNSNRQGTMASVLRALGLDIRGEASRQTGPGVRHLELFRVRATPLDGSLVPGLGSQAAHYMIATTADHKLLRETLTSGFPTKMGPNIVLFDGVLTLDQRRQLLSVCREKKISAIVVDHAVAAFVAARYPRSFRAVQQITLPFTCFTHYTVVAGNVPDEVFVGRSDEIADLTDRAGSLFVYGGRQLGKSALLRKIQRDFNSVPDQHAIFIDLNSHGIGSWADAQRLWPVLYNELTKIDGLPAKPNPNIRNHEPVIRAIREWLEGKESRRFLLLLDEADSFLEKESSDGSAGFRNIGPLKGLFDDTEGRFKPVFAGLHKVQRLQNVANTPLAHGGRDVLIGPLAAKPAYNLVLKPMEALGYRFDNPEAVWRLLAFTNLQPGLIQVVCNDLVAHLQSRPLHKGEPLISISDSDIDAVTSDPRTRGKIAEKLRLTIALEDRYRVIALTVAIMSMQDSFREKYAAGDIRINCEAGWEQGFEDLNSAQFEVYLDELIGLGVLIKDPDNLYSVRSPNIVTMLGTLQELEAELSENREQFELPHEYNPKSTRRQVSVDGATARSPLSEHDLSQIVPVQTKYDPNNFVVTGSDALGIHNVARVLESVGIERGINVTVCDYTNDDATSELSAFKWTGGGTSAPRMLVVDVSRADAQQSADVFDAVQSLGQRSFGHLVVVFGTDGLNAAARLETLTSANPMQLFRLEKWSGDGIRSRHDNPFNTPADRLELLRYSGGWPELVERAVSEVADRGISSGEEWDRLSAFPDSAGSAARFLDSVGVSQDLRPLLAQWAELGSSSYERIADVAAVLDRDVDDMAAFAAMLGLLGILDEDNGDYLIDPVVARAIQRSA